MANTRTEASEAAAASASAAAGGATAASDADEDGLTILSFNYSVNKFEPVRCSMCSTSTLTENICRFIVPQSTVAYRPGPHHLDRICGIAFCVECMNGWSDINPDSNRTRCRNHLPSSLSNSSSSNNSLSGSSRSRPAQSSPARPSQTLANDLYTIFSIDADKLRPQKWYDKALDEPAVLIAMTVGTEYAVDPLEHETLQNFVGKKGKKYGMKKGVPSSNPIVMKREVLRRVVLLNDASDEPRQMPKCANWTKSELEKYLSEIIVPNERPVVNALLTNLCSKLEEDASQVAHASTFAVLRRFHVMLHPSLRDDLVNRNNSATARELDDRNSPNRPLNFYEKAAQMCNSDVSIQSIEMPDLPEPFNKANDLPPPSSNRPATEKDMKNTLTKVSSNVTTLQANFKRSGNGDGNIVPTDSNGNIDLQFVDDNEFVTFVNGPGSQLDMIVVYYLKYILSLDGNMLEEVKQCLDRNAAATMTSVPETSSTARNGRNGGKGGDKRKASDRAVALMEEEIVMRRSEQKLRKKEYRDEHMARLNDRLDQAKRLSMDSYSKFIEATNASQGIESPDARDDSEEANDARDILRGKEMARMYWKDADAQVKTVKEDIKKYQEQVSEEERAEEAEEERRHQATSAAETAMTGTSSTGPWSTLSDDAKRYKALEFIKSHCPPAGNLTQERGFFELREELCQMRDRADLKRILDNLVDKGILEPESIGFEEYDVKYMLLPEDNDEDNADNATASNEVDMLDESMNDGDMES